MPSLTILMVSRDRGRSWTSIAGNLPERDTVYALQQDHVNPKLLFAGTEFGLYFTVDEGGTWIRLKGGLPTIAVRDLALQRRENDLALGTFGRGFYILDDYTPLRTVSAEALEAEALLFGVKDPWLYIEKRSRQGSRGHGFYTADNPPFGATFTYYLKDGLKSLEEQRIEDEKKAEENEEKLTIPSYDELRAEEWEIEPKVVFEIRDADGELVTRVDGERKKGLHRTTWNLRSATMSPARLEPPKKNPWGRQDTGPLVEPGRYTVTMTSEIGGRYTALAEPQSFDVRPLGLATLKAEDRAAVEAFQARAQELYRAVRGASKTLAEYDTRIQYLREALADTVNADPDLAVKLEALRTDLNELRLALEGDATRAKRNVFTPPSISDRVSRIRSDVWETTQAPTKTHQQAYEWAAEAFEKALADLRTIAHGVDQVADAVEQAGGPWTPGRIPEWRR